MKRQKSIGGWGTIHPGGDPFGDSVRSIKINDALPLIREAGIDFVSFHDRDLYPDDAPQSQIEDIAATIAAALKANGLQIRNFTTNLFSHSAFRTGGFSSPYPQVREAAILKAIHGLDAAHIFGACRIIFWGGRDGTDGAYEQDAGLATRRYVMGVGTCMAYGEQRGYGIEEYVEEDKLYEPRLLSAYLNTAATSAVHFRSLLPAHLQDKYRLGPEYPQHTAMLCLDPVIELEQLLGLELLASHIHFGGQITGRMDCDAPPGHGGNYLVDFRLALALRRHEWPGIVEFDCRPLRTTTTSKGLGRFLRDSVGYWDVLETMVDDYYADSQINELEGMLNQPERPELQAVYDTLISGGDIAEALCNLQTGFGGYDVVAAIDSDAVEAYAARVRQVILGY